MYTTALAALQDCASAATGVVRLSLQLCSVTTGFILSARLVDPRTVVPCDAYVRLALRDGVTVKLAACCDATVRMVSCCDSTDPLFSGAC